MKYYLLLYVLFKIPLIYASSKRYELYTIYIYKRPFIYFTYIHTYIKKRPFKKDSMTLTNKVVGINHMLFAENIPFFPYCQICTYVLRFINRFLHTEYMADISFLFYDVQHPIFLITHGVTLTNKKHFRLSYCIDFIVHFWVYSIIHSIAVLMLYIFLRNRALPLPWLRNVHVLLKP